jgi:hypothetical protein
MKKIMFSAILLVIGSAMILSSQSPRMIGGPAIWSVDSSVTFAQCPAPPAGSFSYCQYGSGAAYSSGIVGDPNCPTTTAACWIVYLPMPKATAGVASISVNGGNPMSGPVVLTIPSKATTTLQ